MLERRPVSRRQFLKGAAAVSLAPYIVSRSWGQTPPSERVTLGMIGIGNMGGGHLEALVGNRDFQILFFNPRQCSLNFYIIGVIENINFGKADFR